MKYCVICFMMCITADRCGRETHKQPSHRHPDIKIRSTLASKYEMDAEIMSVALAMILENNKVFPGRQLMGGRMTILASSVRLLQLVTCRRRTMSSTMMWTWKMTSQPLGDQNYLADAAVPHGIDRCRAHVSMPPKTRTCRVCQMGKPRLRSRELKF